MAQKDPIRLSLRSRPMVLQVADRLGQICKAHTHIRRIWARTYKPTYATPSASRLIRKTAHTQGSEQVVTLREERIAPVFFLLVPSAKSLWFQVPTLCGLFPPQCRGHRLRHVSRTRPRGRMFRYLECPSRTERMRS